MTSTPRREAYYDSLVQLDSLILPNHDENIPPFVGCSLSSRQTNAKRRLLVCHDYKGGYNEERQDHSYTFNFWQHCETFIYFSHHRVTIPPHGWISAAHRQGCKVLGTLIFEHTEGEEDCLRLLLGPLSANSSQRPPGINSIPVSPYYARVLASIARQRGFDGYLLNFECPFMGGPDQMRSLCEWIEMFRMELVRQVGPHAELLWYDSVVITGQLRWQDRLNHYNLPFFGPSTGFFTNYTWHPHYPALMANFFSSLPPRIKGSKTLSDIYVGVDVWGRNQHAGGMLHCHKALSHVYPIPHPTPTSASAPSNQDPEYSVALFGQAWTWESVCDSENMDWDTWFRFEQKFWIGEPASAVSARPALGKGIGIPPPSERPVPPCSCDKLPHAPLTSYFSAEPRPAPNPLQIPFWSTFCPGVGNAWFVDGRRVDDGATDREHKWTDVGKQTSLGDLLWPDPKLFCEDVPMGDIWLSETTLDMSDAWIGGSSLKLSLAPAVDAETASEGGETEDAFFSLFIPVQSVSTTPGQHYDVVLVYKTLDLEEAGVVDLDLGIAVRVPSPPGDDDAPQVLEVVPAQSGDLDTASRNGWTKVTASFVVPSKGASSTPGDAVSHVGVQLSIVTTPTNSSSKTPFSLLLGQLTVSPSPPPDVPIPSPIVTTVEAFPSEQGSVVDHFKIAWLTAYVHNSPLNTVNLSLPPDYPDLAWPAPVPASSPGHRAQFAFMNLYAEISGAGTESTVGSEQVARRELRWLGTSGVDVPQDEYIVDFARLKEVLSIFGRISGLWKGDSDLANLRVKIWVQGVTDRGEVMSLDGPGSNFVLVELGVEQVDAEMEIVSNDNV